MNGNQTFSFPRFGALIRKSWIEDWRSLLLMAGTMLGALTLIGILIAWGEYYDGRQPETYATSMIHSETIWFGIAFIVGGMIFAARSFSSLQTPQSSLSSLMLPASQFEKYLYRFILAVPVYFIVAFLFAVVADWLRVVFVDLCYDVAVRPMSWGKVMFPPEDVDYIGMKFTPSICIAYLMIQSFYFLGSIVWPKHSFVKTFLVVGLIFFGYILWGAWIMTTFEVDGMMIPEPSWLKDRDDVIRLFDIISAVIIVFNYCLAFFRFRESETINRW